MLHPVMTRNSFEIHTENIQIKYNTVSKREKNSRFETVLQ